MLGALLACPAIAAPAAASLPRQAGGGGERVLAVDLLDNGSFAEVASGPVTGIPWWAVPEGASAPRVAESGHGRELALAEGQALEQPFVAHVPTLEGLVVRGRVRGSGRLVLIDGEGGRTAFALASEGGEPEEFEVGLEEWTERLGRRPRPRFLLRLEPANDGGRVFWSGLEALVPLPCPSEDALRAEIGAWLEGYFGPWLDRARDRFGPRPTAFLANRFDAVTGEPIDPEPRVAATLHPTWEQIFQAWRADPRPEWGALLEGYLEDLFRLGLNPDTGLPRNWDPVADRPLDDAPLEIARHFTLLLDVAEAGPSGMRERARAAAVRIGRLVLERGVLPDGQVAAIYRPRDGEAFTDVVALRRLDVPARLARIGALTGEDAFLDAAAGALLELEHTHFWPGTWQAIDPGFDDNFGHYGARAAEMWAAHPGEDDLFGRSARRVLLSGWERYREIWPDALRFGATIAADQVRSWRILIELSELAPEHRPEVSRMLASAVRSHFKGQQAGAGAWMDLSFLGFRPRDVPFGDVGGVPQNLLDGLGAVYRDDLGLRTDEVRAMFTAVMRSSLEAYGQPHGLIVAPRLRTGARAMNPADGTVRLGVGMVTMFAALHAG